MRCSSNRDTSSRARYAAATWWVSAAMKRTFGLGLVLQGVDRLTLSDRVYLAVGEWPKQMKNVKKLCRRLGLGLLVVAGERADVVLDPVPYKPRTNKRKA